MSPREAAKEAVLIYSKRTYDGTVDAQRELEDIITRQIEWEVAISAELALQLKEAIMFAERDGWQPNVWRAALARHQAATEANT